MITIRVQGVPVPQGSIDFFGKGRMKYRDDLKPWRDKIRAEYIRQHGSWRIEGAVRLEAEFILPRPKNHYGTGANAGIIKASYVKAKPTTKPDVDKLLRSCGDALTLGDLPKPFDDDAQITESHSRKRYVDQGEQPGVVIVIGVAY